MKWAALFVAAFIAFSISITGFAQSPHPWPMFRHDASRTAASALPGPSDPGLIWSFTSESSSIPFSGIISTAAVSSGDRVYVGAVDNNFYSLTSRGAINWSYKGDDYFLQSPALGTNERVCVGSGTQLYNFTSEGALVWSYDAVELRFSSPAIGSDGAIYAGSNADNLFSFGPSGSLLWSYATVDNINSSPALGSDGRVYFGAEDNNFYAISSNGAFSWSYRTGEPISSSSAVAADGRAYVTGEDNVLYSFAPAGSLLWSYSVHTGSPLVNSSPALISDGRLFVSSDDSNFYSFAPSGSLAWSFRTGSPLIASPVIGENDVAYAGGYNGVLYAFNSNGTLMWTYTSGEGMAYGFNTALGIDRRIFLSSLSYFGGGGGFQCVSERPPSLDVIPSSNSPAVGDSFTVDVTVKPIGGAFDAWSVILAPGGRQFSFNLGRPSSLRSGMSMLASNIPGLEQPFSSRLLSLNSIPNGAAGTYTIIVGLVPAGRRPTMANAISDYLDQEVVVIH